MTERIRRLGRLGLFVAMAGTSWLIEACGGTATEPREPATGGTGAGNAPGGSTGAASPGTGGTTTGGTSPVTGGAGGEGGLHDLPCE